VSIDHTSQVAGRGSTASRPASGPKPSRTYGSTFDCKAAHVRGMLRQFIEAAGLQLASQYHVGALVSAASAVGLVLQA
jgi:hypothetical protein